MKLFHNTKKIKLTKETLIHDFFEIGILLKGLDGALQIIGGFLLMFVNPTRLSKIVLLITQHELFEDPNDQISQYLIKLSNSFSINAQHFAIIYLLVHGLIKLTLYILLVNNKKGAYPIAIVSLSLFVIYQLYEYSISGSIFMMILTILDVIVILLTILEYRQRKIKSQNI